MDSRVVKMIQAEPDAANPESDAYMTAYAIVLLREEQKAKAFTAEHLRVSRRVLQFLRPPSVTS